MHECKKKLAQLQSQGTFGVENKGKNELWLRHDVEALEQEICQPRADIVLLWGHKRKDGDVCTYQPITQFVFYSNIRLQKKVKNQPYIADFIYIVWKS